jgi:hypothetical protein
VPALRKPAGILCPNCTGGGCAIYETRPEPCQTYFCMWRQVGTMPDEFRPDRIGVIFSIETVNPPQNPFEKRFVLGRAVNNLADLDSPGARAALQTFIERGDLPVWLSYQQERRLLHPYPVLYKAIISPANPPPELAAEVRLWRERLGIGTA